MKLALVLWFIGIELLAQKPALWFKNLEPNAVESGTLSRAASYQVDDKGITYVDTHAWFQVGAFTAVGAVDHTGKVTELPLYGACLGGSACVEFVTGQELSGYLPPNYVFAPGGTVRITGYFPGGSSGVIFEAPLSGNVWLQTKVPISYPNVTSCGFTAKIGLPTKLAPEIQSILGTRQISSGGLMQVSLPSVSGQRETVAGIVNFVAFARSSLLRLY